MVREYIYGDYREITRVHVDTWKTTYRGLVPDEYLDKMNYEDKYESNKKFMSREDVGAFVYEKDEKIVGFTSCGEARDKDYNGWGELYGLYILKEFQGLGIGKELFEAVKNELKDKGFSKMVLWAMSGNSAEIFYRKMGGVKSDKVRKYSYGGKEVDIVSFEYADLNN